jgi:hypothetical protein
MNTLNHKHTWEYTVTSSIDGQYNIKFEIDGDTSLDNIVYRFESYLRSIRYYPPNNTVLEFVEKF